MTVVHTELLDRTAETMIFKKNRTMDRHRLFSRKGMSTKDTMMFELANEDRTKGHVSCQTQKNFFASKLKRTFCNICKKQ